MHVCLQFDSDELACIRNISTSLAHGMSYMYAHACVSMYCIAENFDGGKSDKF